MCRYFNPSGLQICDTAGDDAEASGYESREQSVAYLAESLQDDYGQQEAIAKFGHDPRIYQTTVQEFIKDKNGNVKQAKIVKLESKKDEKTGRMMMVPVEGSEFLLDVDLVLIAAGFLGSQEYVTKAFGVNVDGRTNVATEPGKHATNVKNVFTAGDMHMGQSLVVRAIREGRDVAREVDESLMGYTNL